MAVYRFRVTFEDPEDVFREIDIQGKQTFEDFHQAIQEAISFDNSKEASFFMSDDFWKKGQEITLHPRPVDEDDDDDYRNPKPQPKIMNKSRIVEYIDDPHQKIIYIFDTQAQWTFFIELMRIVNEEPKTVYPKCTKSSGAAPKQYKQTIAPPVDDEFDDEDDDDAVKKEKVFHAEEEYDADEKVGDDSEDGDTDEAEGGGESEEGGDDAVDPGAFGGEEDL